MLHNERGQKLYENYINSFLEEIISGKWAILGPKMTHGHNSGSSPRIFLKSCTIKETKRYIKITLTIFLMQKYINGFSEIGFRTIGSFWAQN